MGKHFISRYLYIFYCFVFILHIINVFLESETMNDTIGWFALVMLVVSFAGASRLFKILGMAFLFVGGTVYLTAGQSIIAIPSLFTSNMSLLVLLSMLPWMNSVVKSGRFDKSLNSLLHVNAKDLGSLYPRSSAITLTLASFLNLSAATISQDVLKEQLQTLKKDVRDSFIGTSTLRGYTLALLWSPLEILLAVTIFTTGVGYVSLLPWLLLIAGITFLLDSLWGRFYYRKYNYRLDREVNIDKKALIKKIAHLLLALILFLVLVIAIGNNLNLDFIFTVTILIFPFSLVWSIVMKRFKSFWTIGWRTWIEKTNTMQNFVVLFLSLAFFANSINDTPFLLFIQQPIIALAEYPFIIFVIIQLIFIGLSMFGVHPIATIGMLSGIVAVLIELMNPLSLAIVMITSAIATLTVGSYGLVVQLTSNNTGQSPYRITLNNLPYALIFGGIGSFVGYILL
ncbi:hypothetical protein D8M04_18195 [Oceanobacillus piezotolerans]|uniref:Uncharacterized protein n=1 Tax=Oceanobacillus piezotolerans TaxID=2448030 RepID=A0A498D2B1_9BACI|nr:hypothetical protein [Oceanobacillus piezotolerans]RLL40698.1 hypothetical protein D8M04_18195 [Oceanobacillus piezotolerans]